MKNGIFTATAVLAAILVGGVTAKAMQIPASDRAREVSVAPETGRVRRDAVRELAISRGVIPEAAIRGAQPLDPVQASRPE